MMTTSAEPMTALSDLSCSLSLIHDFELRRGDELVPMSATSQRLISFVALHDRPVRRTHVSGTLWFNSAEERANASLRSALWRVPAPGGVTVLSASATHVWMNPAIQVDFRTIITRAYSLLDSVNGDIAVIDVAREMCAFRDELLPGWYDDWVVMERERFHYLRLQALDHLGERLRLCGRFGDALQVGLAAVQAEPLHETAHRLLIQIHIQQGNIAEAVRQYRRYESTLAQDVGARPSSSIQELIHPCIAGPGRAASPARECPRTQRAPGGVATRAT